jgi:hypothetical protein
VSLDVVSRRTTDDGSSVVGFVSDCDYFKRHFSPIKLVGSGSAA